MNPSGPIFVPKLELGEIILYYISCLEPMKLNFGKKLTIFTLIPLLLVAVAPSIIAESFALDMVTCSEGYVLVKKTSTGNHACLTESSAKTVESRNWGTIVSSNDSVTFPGSLLTLSRANVPATIPMHQGYFDDGDVHFIITDSSDETHANLITENQGWKVELAPLLKNSPNEALSTTYMFTNGITGDGVHGFQNEIFSSTPAQPDVYSGLSNIVHVSWNDVSSATILKSASEVIVAVDEDSVTTEQIGVILNTPQIVWPEGQMMVKEDKTLADDTPYGGGQVLDIDTEDMTVTFVAHRGWGPDGRTIYYIVTDATPSGPAGMMGVVDAPTSASLIASSAAVDLFQFKNGITGSGPLGFQPGIAASAPGDVNYSPMWRISMIGWEDENNASVLETMSDINAYQKAGLITVGLARPMDSDHIVNCPFIDPFQ